MKKQLEVLQQRLAEEQASRKKMEEMMQTFMAMQRPQQASVRRRLALPGSDALAAVAGSSQDRPGPIT